MPKPYFKPYTIRIKSIRNHRTLMNILHNMGKDEEFVITKTQAEFCRTLEDMILMYTKK